MVVEPALDEHIVRMLIRYFRQGNGVRFGQSDSLISEDLEYLRIQWAISGELENLVNHLLHNRHEAQASQEFDLQCSSGFVRGRLLTNATVIERRVSGDRSRSVYYEPKKSFAEGPNHVLGWVIQMSRHVLRRYKNLLDQSKGYNARVSAISDRLESCARLSGIGEAIEQTNVRSRPSKKAVVQAGKSRRMLYRRAYDAFLLLCKIESGDEQTVMRLLNHSLVGPLEEWQKFELLLALRMAETLSKTLKTKLTLHPIEYGSSRPIASFGDCDVYWQSRSPLQSFPEPEPSERIVNEILMHFKIGVGSDRPDVVVVDRVKQSVLALGEAKFFGGVGSWTEGVRAAVEQLVRYSRLYSHCNEQGALLRKSIIAVSNLPGDAMASVDCSQTPVPLSLLDLQNDNMLKWAERFSTED
ncbi:hypothetical protein SV7mr_49260 [Stieleria bergensis]|uniref:5-methylcytosine-specific restriction enzyme subunit McrC n=2 Tax=Stieleria bergensis TaxID=2528025 RepID=A0A517T1Y4_9BACT|nr:hypothetical protein SV7mr_49260 [Planctomycetes bacterium SV_7m_r]